MRATIDRLTAKDATSLLARHVKAGNYGPPVFATVRVEAYDNRVTFASTNIDATVRVTIRATVTEPGVFLVDRKTLVGIVKAGPATLELATDTQTETAVLGSIRIGSATLPVIHQPDDFPTLPVPGPYVGQWTPSDRETVGTVARFASTDEGRPVLTGVFFESSEAAATDSYRLSVGPVSSYALDGALVPAVAVRNVSRWKISDPSVDDAVAVHRASDGYTGDRVTWAGTIVQGPKRSPRTVHVSYTVRTIEGSFPRYGVLLPERGDVDRDALLVHVDRDGLLAALDVVLPLAKTSSNTPVRLELDGSTVTLTVRSEGAEASSSVPVHVENTARFGDTFEIAFNPAFLVEAVSVLPDGPVSFTFRDGLKPARIDHVDRDGSAGLLMPMRVN